MKMEIMMVALLSKRFERFNGTITHQRKRGGHHLSSKAKALDFGLFNEDTSVLGHWSQSRLGQSKDAA
jgi:hypothetical protein